MGNGCELEETWDTGCGWTPMDFFYSFDFDFYSSEFTDYGSADVVVTEQLPSVTVTGQRSCTVDIATDWGSTSVDCDSIYIAPQITVIGISNTDRAKLADFVDGMVPVVDLNRQPACLREQLFVEQTLATIATTGAPVGSEIIPAAFINDPSYSGGNWSKYQTGQIDRVANSTGTVRYAMTIHYMYNHVTNAVSQVKLKNSEQAGCVGETIGI
jgi:hypothetical protein